MMNFTYQLVQVVTQKISADIPTMTIINTEERAFRPIAIGYFFVLWLHNVENDGNSVFIIVPNITKSDTDFLTWLCLS